MPIDLQSPTKVIPRVEKIEGIVMISYEYDCAGVEKSHKLIFNKKGDLLIAIRDGLWAHSVKSCTSNVEEWEEVVAEMAKSE